MSQESSEDRRYILICPEKMDGRAAPRLNNPNDPILQEYASRIATTLRRSDCDSALDMQTGLELVEHSEGVDLFLAYISGSARVALRFPVVDGDRATGGSSARGTV